MARLFAAAVLAACLAALMVDRGGVALALPALLGLEEVPRLPDPAEGHDASGGAATGEGEEGEEGGQGEAPPVQDADAALPPESLSALLGAGVYTRSCAGCHGAAGQGSARSLPLIGPDSGVRRMPREELLAFVTQRMPFYAPGSLSDEEYEAVVDFLRRANGLP